MRLLLAALVLTMAGPQAWAAPANDETCHCHRHHSVTADRSQDLHRPSSAEEREATARLNREFLASAQPAKTPASAPASASVVRPPDAFSAYQTQLQNYRKLQESYDRRIKEYYRVNPPRLSQAYPPAPPPSAPRNDARWQDASRLDPWKSYNPGPGNGY